MGKKAYYKKYFSEHKNNLQKVWKGIKEIINIKSKNFDHPTCIQEGDQNITDPAKIANSLTIILHLSQIKFSKGENIMVPSHIETSYPTNFLRILFLKIAMTLK